MKSHLGLAKNPQLVAATAKALGYTVENRFSPTDGGWIASVIRNPNGVWVCGSQIHELTLGHEYVRLHMEKEYSIVLPA